MKSIKHIGRLKNTGSKVLVVFRTLPGESNHALIVQTSNLPDAYHDSIMSLVESDSAQESFEFGELMHVRHFPDGKPMLRALQAEGRLQKVSTDTVIMTPTVSDSIPLDQLNVLIAEQKNCAVDDLCMFVKGAPPKTEKINDANEVTDLMPSEQQLESKLQSDPNAVLSDLDLAKSYRSQADSLYKEAARLRKQADELDPPKKKTSAKTEASVETTV
jgi:hypothetical protein